MTAITVKIDGVPLAVTLDEDGNVHSISIGGVDIGTLLDTVSGGNSRAWWAYFEAVVAREQRLQRKEADERMAHDVMAEAA